MTIHEECRKQTTATTDTEEEMAPVCHSREEIDQINILAAMLVIRVETRVIGSIMMKNHVILTIMRIVQKGMGY